MAIIAGNQLTATVTAATPLTIIVDGADTSNPAESLDAVAYTIGDRVQITARTPRQPLVTGKVETA